MYGYMNAEKTLAAMYPELMSPTSANTPVNMGNVGVSGVAAGGPFGGMAGLLTTSNPSNAFMRPADVINNTRTAAGPIL